jgi:NAD(P)-dependent dehydrogenase (short-subunit alcohol dehydrogenase family)
VQDQCRALIAQAVEHFGHIDTLVNNAGVSAHALLQDVAADDLQWYERLMQINLWGSVWCTHAALPYLKARKGRIVAVSSLAGLIGVPGRTAYSASKFAMTGFFEALRAELVHAGVSVTVAYPGVVLTQIRYHGYNAKGERAGHSGLREDGAMCVFDVLRGTLEESVDVAVGGREVIAAAIEGLDIGGAERLVQTRQRAPFKSLDDAQKLLPATTTADPVRVGVMSSFFEVRGRIRLEDRVLEELSLVERRGLEVIALQRQRYSLRDGPG